MYTAVQLLVALTPCTASLTLGRRLLIITFSEVVARSVHQRAKPSHQVFFHCWNLHSIIIIIIIIIFFRPTSTKP